MDAPLIRRVILRLIAAVALIIAPFGVTEVSLPESALHAISDGDRHFSQKENPQVFPAGFPRTNGKAESLDPKISRLDVSGSLSAQDDHTDHETPTPAPVEGRPPGERNPLVAVIAAVAIVVVGVTGIFIYRMIREGL